LVLKSFFSPYPYSVNWVQSKEMMQRLQQVLSGNQFDLLHVDTIGLVPYASCLKEVPRVLNHHNIESDMMRRRVQNEPNFFKKIYFIQEAIKIRSVEKTFCPLFEQNLVVSHLDRERLEKIIPGLSTAAVANGVDTEYFKPAPRDPIPDHLVMVGGMSWYPNRDAALYFFRAIWPLLLQDMPEVTITVIGRHPPDEITSLAQRDTRVSVLGFVDDIRPAVADAAVYVCSIRDGGGTRLKILDALAMGKAIVCTRFACEGIDVVPDQHVLVADAPQAFARHVIALLRDIPKRRGLEQNARSLALQYGWSNIAVHLNHAYDCAMNRKRAKGNDVASPE
jgi:glycosyltransferase involved in cell wall biosynthesis